MKTLHKYCLDLNGTTFSGKFVLEAKEQGFLK